MSESYPTWNAGEDITASKLMSMLPMVARKTADEVVNNSGTAQDDNELFFTVAANAVYILDGWIKYDASATADFLVDWTAPANALGEWTGWGAGLSAASGTAGYSIRTETNDLTQARSFGAVGVGNIVTLIIHGTIRTGNTAGTYQFQWAQGTADASNCTVYTDSWLRLQRVA